MAGIKHRGVITHHIQRTHEGRDIKPCKWFSGKTGSGIMVQQYKDTGDVVRDEQGNPVHWRSSTQ